MRPKLLLHLEGLTLFVAAVGAYLALGEPLWLFALAILAPDLGMAGYLAGPRVGSWTYNAVHTYPLPAVLLGAGLAGTRPLAVAVALVWFAHIGADRAIGYGLKYESGFGDTHMSQV